MAYLERRLTSWHTYVEELLENDASEVYVRRMKTKEVLVPKEVDKITFPFVNGSVKVAGKTF